MTWQVGRPVTVKRISRHIIRMHSCQDNEVYPSGLNDIDQTKEIVRLIKYTQPHCLTIKIDHTYR
jgi:hypothetical protein